MNRNDSDLSFQNKAYHGYENQLVVIIKLYYRN